jgi:N-acyl homoserine lactone hydrolase
MGKTYSIRPIPLCISGSELSRYTYRMGYGVGCICCSYAWYIEGASRHILVDTGINAELFSEYGWKVPKYDIQSLEQGLAKLGLKPEDIDLVIITHLHFDHCGMGYKYPKAKFLVQQAEFDAAQTPLPYDPYTVFKSSFKGLDLQTVDGDYQVEEGIRCLFTPGHTIGGQSVAVDTAKGTAVIDSMCSQWENYYPNPAMYRPGPKLKKEDMPPEPEVALPSLRSDNEVCYKSLIRIKSTADILIPLHDPRFIGVDRIP